MVDSPNTIINIQLGDILKFIAPTNDNINEQTFYIKYIDSEKIVLINSETLILITIRIDIDGQLEDNSIESIELLSRAPFLGYAKQNVLETGIWIDIYFGGETPTVITGEITDLEEDMIEIKTYPNNDIIYIDFEYKGIPEHLLIEKIVIRSMPISIQKEDVLEEIQEEHDPLIASLSADALKDKLSQGDDDEDLADIEDDRVSPSIQLKEILLDADQILIGMDLDEITHIIDVPDDEKRFGIDKQTNDLLDELLSDIPNYKRTNIILNDIHKMIERYKQLRLLYSEFDETGNANIPKPIEESHKPIIENILKLDKRFHWLLPISHNIKKFYYNDPDNLLDIEVDDIEPIGLDKTLNDEESLIEMYKTGEISEDENKYVYLFKQLNKLFTPFTDPIYPENGITTQEVKTNILSMVNNLGDLHSSVATDHDGSITRKRFLLETYIPSLLYLKENIPTQLTKSDSINIKSILILPIQALLFSRIDLPTTNILSRSELNKNYISYWKIFNKETDIKTTIIGEDYETTPNIFSDTSPVEYISEQDDYVTYLNSIIPKTNDLIDLLKNQMDNRLSSYSIIKFLELLMIYHENINSNHLEIINEIVNEEIINYKRQFAALYKHFSKNKQTKYIKPLCSLLQLLSSNPELETLIFNAYELNRNINYTDAEIINIIKIDYGKLFTTVITKIDIELQATNLVDNFVKKYEQLTTEKKALSNKCKTIVKKYTNMGDLIGDSEPGKIVYVDLESKLAPTSDKKLIQRIVKDNDYAILVVGETPTPPISGKGESTTTPGVVGETPTYYIRKNNNWIKDDKLTEDMKDMVDTVVVGDNVGIGDLSREAPTKDCVDFDKEKHNINEQTLEAIYKEFDATYGEKEDEMQSKVDNLLESNLKSIRYLKRLEKINFLNYDNLMKKLSLDIIDDDEESELTFSPYEYLRDIILEQSDWVKKQFDIQRFVLHFTREPFETDDQHWLYCYKTNTKLLPRFLGHLANVYLSNGDYLYQVDVICTEQGTISDDGDSWVDEYSGYFIKKIDLDTEEGYTEEGFKLKTREVLEADLGDAVLKRKNPVNKENLETDETRKITNIISAITGFMGIDISVENDFIIRNVLSIHTSSIKKESNYKKKEQELKEKGKKNVPTYEEYINTSYLIFTLSFILIAIQVSIPSIKSRKTFPGCIRSFTGYPFDGTDKSALTYIACIANKIKSSTPPWNSIKRSNESSIEKLMEERIDKYIMKNIDIIKRFNQKREYLKTETKDIKLLEYEIEQFVNFLPPLQEFSITGLINISEAFKEQLRENIATGSYFQQEQILTIKSKIIAFSLAIQEKIQKIVNKKTPLITNNVSEPFLENACCDDKSTNMYKYFSEIDKDIITYNQIVIELDNMLYDLKHIAKPAILFDPRDTKYKYPEIISEFSEETIYRTFLFYCKNTTFLSDELRAVCIEHPENIYLDDSIDKQIERLKSEGINYTEELLQKLITVINIKNTVHLNINHTAPDNIQYLTEVLETIEHADTTDNRLIPDEFIRLFKVILDTYSISLKEDTVEMRDFKNYLAISNIDLIKKIEEFIKINSKLSKTKFKQFQDCLQNITKFIENSDNVYINSKDETVFKMINFIKNSINNIVDIFPNIILNKVNYSSINIPKHWKLSQIHTNDIKEIVNKYYSKLNQFYGDTALEPTLQKIQNDTKNIQLLATYTPFFAYINDEKQTEIYSIFDRKLVTLLYNFYFLKTLESLIGGISIPPSSVGDIKDNKTPEELEEELVIPIGDMEVSTTITVDYLISIMEIICNDKKQIDYNYESIMEKVLRSKEKEKDIITERLRNLEDEEHKVDTILKMHKLEQWGKGLQKGLVQYDPENYDQERGALEQQAIKERKLGTKSAVTDMNKDIYNLDLDAEMAREEEIDAEENNMDDIPDDDDYGDEDGDE